MNPARLNRDEKFVGWALSVVGALSVMATGGAVVMYGNVATLRSQVDDDRTTMKDYDRRLRACEHEFGAEQTGATADGGHTASAGGRPKG